MNATESERDRRSFEIPVHASAGSRLSAEVMVKLLAPMLRRLAQRYEEDAPSRSDLQQEMLIAVWLSLDTYEKNCSFHAWVHNVARAVGLRHVAMRHATRLTEQSGDDLENLPHPYDTESLVALREQILVLLSLLRGLRPREREAVLLDLQEFEMREMSDVLRLSQSQVRDALVRARRRLTLWMRKRDADSGEDSMALDPSLAVDPDPQLSSSWATRIREAGGPVYFIAPPRK